MEIMQYGETFKRYAYIGKTDRNQYFVSFTDWPARKGGSISEISLNRAKYLANKFIKGCEYYFDPIKGIRLSVK
jgi:hypothetical protein